MVMSQAELCTFVQHASADPQEKYASRFGKYDLVKQEAIKRKERLNNIEKEIKNWRDLKENSCNKLEELKELQISGPHFFQFL